MDVGIARADQGSRGRIEQARNLHLPQPEAGEEKQRREQDGQVQPGRRLDHEPPGTQHDVAAQPVERDQEEETEHDERGQQPDRGRQRGQREDVESDVAREDRVGDAELRLVDRLEHQVPGRRGGEAGQQPDGQRDRQAQAAKSRRDVQVRRRLLELEHDRVGHEAPLRRPQIHVEQAGGEAAYDQEDQPPGGQLPGEDDLVPDLAEPPPVGEQDVESREQEQHREGGEQHDREAASEHRQSSDAGRVPSELTREGGRVGGRAGGQGGGGSGGRAGGREGGQSHVWRSSP